jgi:GNAT superfamily N-acetyltransferase
MVFWENYSIKNIIKTRLNNKSFLDLQFKRNLIPSPTGIDAKIVNINNKPNIIKIKHFIKSHFGNPPHTPILDIPEDKLLGLNDLLLYVEDKTGKIAGCIRYHYIGTFIEQPLYCNDCFCVHPEWRKKGIGDYLLNTLHQIVNSKKLHYSMFLKEGSQLSILHRPFYSSIYIYKKLDIATIHNISSLTIKQAYKLIDILTQFNSDIFIIRNINSINQHWKLYKNGSDYVLACIQDTYQYFNEDNKINKIGWITAWIESPNISDTNRQNALDQIANTAYGIFDYIWANKAWSYQSNSWKADGPFHWYLYQWTTSINIKTSYCILN